MFFRRLTSIGSRLQRRLTRSSTIIYQLDYLETGGLGTSFPFKGLTGRVVATQRGNQLVLTIRVKGQDMIHRPITLYSKPLSQDLSGLYESADSRALIGVIDSSLLQIEATDPDGVVPIIVRASRK
ncbi:hypothetical protein [Spirosoma sp.]|uniref:hypothetical protein n=1 Tax=Spirosoma sp. TaxID=1899569 RepID=UPI002607A261|nr:hypothetical protein [Spirosoma sp.]MCX6216341.1 hypothetical protein [Spirosoma sp.]